jgi:predicted small lipoprotein YifL
VILIVKSHSGLLRCVAFFILAGCMGALTGCGQQGPLYLPDAKPGAHGKPAGKQGGKVPTLPPPVAAPAAPVAPVVTPAPSE